jgi:GcrA cell cycle regulator
MAWTEEADAKLRELIARKLTASQIAALLGVSRNAVIGRVNRIGLHLWRSYGGVNNPFGQKGGPKPIALIDGPPKVKRRTGFQPAMRERIAFPAPAGEPPIDLSPTTLFWPRTSFQCAWINGEPSFDAMCCGRPVVEGRPYCLAHYRMAYQRPGDYRRASRPPEERSAPPALNVAA